MSNGDRAPPTCCLLHRSLNPKSSSVSLFGSKYDMVVSLVRPTLMALSAAAWSGPYSHCASFLVSVHSGAEIKAKSFLNCEQWLAIPSRLLISPASCGSLACCVTATMLGFAEMPSAEKMNPKHSSLDLLNSHFFLLRVRPLYFILWNTAEVVIMLRLEGAIDDNVVTQVFYPSEALESLADCVLKHLRS